MKKVGILYHPMKNDAQPLAKKLEDYFSSKSLKTWVCSAWEGETAKNQLNGTDLIISIGGDGTILRAAQTVIPEAIPIIGINLGKLGFMTELSVNETMAKISTLLDGEGWIDERYVIEARFLPANDGQKSQKLFYALNDIIIRGAVAKVVYIETSIDDERLTTYKADGVIVATATGSTGYALAANGPILHPQNKDLLLLPVVPHLSTTYSLVVPSTNTVKLVVINTHSSTLSVDGHINLPLSSGDSIMVKHSSKTVQFLRIHPKTSFYSSLEQKLRGKQ
ncbi:NAD(+)/NADH kinase [Chloroflexota bacterium]